MFKDKKVIFFKNRNELIKIIFYLKMTVRIMIAKGCQKYHKKFITLMF